MAQSYATLKANIAQRLQDTAMATYLTAELTEVMDDVLRDISFYVPYVLPVAYNLESRSGTASSTSAGKLIDTTKSQFVSGDAGKIIRNTTDYTWAVVVTQDSTSQLTLSKDIMASGESYRIFNAGCRHSYEINLTDVLDYHTDVVKVEFPVGYNPPNWRNFIIERDNILRLLIDGPVDDSSSSSAEKEVLVYVAKRHVVSQLTDLAGALDGAHSAGATSIVLKNLSGTEVIEVDQEFTIANMRGIYTVATGVTLVAGGGTVVVYPGLQSAGANNDVVTLKQSTLTPQLETLFCQLAAGRAPLSKVTKQIDKVNIGGAKVPMQTLNLGRSEVAMALNDLRRIARPRTLKVFSRD